MHVSIKIFSEKGLGVLIGAEVVIRTTLVCKIECIFDSVGIYFFSASLNYKVPIV